MKKHTMFLVCDVVMLRKNMQIINKTDIFFDNILSQLVILENIESNKFY